MAKFELNSSFKPAGDQPQAIKQLIDGLRKGKKFQTLMGVTGSGKTFTMANVIARLNRPARLRLRQTNYPFGTYASSGE